MEKNIALDVINFRSLLNTAVSVSLVTLLLPKVLFNVINFVSIYYIVTILMHFKLYKACVNALLRNTAYGRKVKISPF